MANVVDVCFDTQLSRLLANGENTGTEVDLHYSAIQEVVDTINPEGTSRVFLDYVHDDSVELESATHGFTFSLKDPEALEGLPEWFTRRLPPADQAYDAYVCVRLGGGITGALLDDEAAKKIKTARGINGISSAPSEKSIARELNIRIPDECVTEVTAHELQHAIDIANEALDENSVLGAVDKALEFIEDRLLLSSVIIAGLGTELARRKMNMSAKKTVATFILSTLLSGLALPHVTHGGRYLSYRLDPNERKAFKTGRLHSGTKILDFNDSV